MKLHRAFGHMRDNRLGRSEHMVGGAPLPYSFRCSCAQCEAWIVAFDEFDAQGNPVAPPLEEPDED